MTSDEDHSGKRCIIAGGERNEYEAIFHVLPVEGKIKIFLSINSLLDNINQRKIIILSEKNYAAFKVPL